MNTEKMRIIDKIAGRSWLLYFRSALSVLTFMIFFVLIFQDAGAGEGERKFSYPGDGHRFSAPEAKFDVSFVTRPDGQNNDYNYDLFIIDKKGDVLIQHPFMRQVEGEWFFSGNQLYFNDYLGSTQIDCFVWVGASKSLVSLTDLLLNDPNSGPKQGNGAKPPETPKNSRFEMTCEGWKQNGDIQVNMTGNTWSGGDFNYNFVYSPSKRYFEWR